MRFCRGGETALALPLSIVMLRCLDEMVIFERNMKGFKSLSVEMQRAGKHKRTENKRKQSENSQAAGKYANM
jgi:hypothetical protein